MEALTEQELSAVIQAVSDDDRIDDATRAGILAKLQSGRCKHCGAVSGRMMYCSNKCKQSAYRRRKFEAHRRAMIPAKYR